ncbi:MAG: hypothetical protein R2911_17830 [Caldilineaceae bacterium]
MATGILLALAAALLFGYTQALQNELLLAGVTTIPRQFVSMLPYVVTIVAVAGFVGRVRPPRPRARFMRRKRIEIYDLGFTIYEVCSFVL